MIAATSIPIAQSPLHGVTPGRPKVLIGIGNSQSMDGNINGSMLIGSGTPLGEQTAQSGLEYVSPVYYDIPEGFTPPLKSIPGKNSAPNTVNINGVLYDNSASRLNETKAGIKNVISTFMENTDFALETYATGNKTVASTWLYYTSKPGSNFIFTNSPKKTDRYVFNPCYNYQNNPIRLREACISIAKLYGENTLSSNKFMLIDHVSEETLFNDVLYARNKPLVFLAYDGPRPNHPFPPYYNIEDYNNGRMSILYNQTLPDIGKFVMTPSNAGYVPFSRQVMFAQRGFGYYSSQAPSQGAILVPMTALNDNPIPTHIDQAINKFLPYLKPETNNPATTEIKATAYQSPLAGLFTTAKTYFSSLPKTKCSVKEYMILISDGSPTQDLSGGIWPPLNTPLAEGYGLTAFFNPDGSLNTTNHRALAETINSIKILRDDGVKTFIVGLGPAIFPSINPLGARSLTAMAKSGGTIDYYPAYSPKVLVDDLNSILAAIQAGSYATSSAAINASNLKSNAMEYQTSFTPDDNKYSDWTGNIKAIPLDPKTGFPTATVLWNANTLLDANTSRKIATWNPSINNGLGAGVPFQWQNLDLKQQAAFRKPTPNLSEQRLDYIRGSHRYEKNNGSIFRNRTHLLGDIVNSAPLFVGPPNNPLLFGNNSYRDFIKTHANRIKMLYVGGNDGMLHAFNASNGVELFAFIPNAVFQKLYHLSVPNYNQSHLYFVDGSPESADIQYSNGTWHTILVGGEGRGGNSIFAIDITDPSSIVNETILAKKILWEITDYDLGLTLSPPKIGQIATNDDSKARFAVFFGNGYNNSNNNAVLYAVNPENGKLIRKINLCTEVRHACNPDRPEGLSAIALGQIDGLQGVPITTVYAGDLQGNLWAIDVGNPNPNQWRARLLFQAKDSKGVPQPITTAPLVTLNPSYPRFPGLFVMFGTGQFLSPNDLTHTQTQTIYGVWDRPNSQQQLSRLNLQSQTLQVVTSKQSGFPQDILVSTTNAIAWNNTYGWYTDLPITGARIMTDSQLINGSFITTINIPPRTACDSPSSIFLDIDYRTGGAFPNAPQLDVNGDGKIDASDKYQNMNPVGIFLGEGYSSGPASIGRNENNHMVQIITMSNGKQIPIIHVNNSSRQTGWWQIQSK